MMRKLFLTSTLFFWLAIGFFWTAAVSAPEPDSRQAPAVDAFGMDEVARHADKTDCWMAIAGQVYDLTAYLPQHPTDPGVILPWCGKDAGEAYRTKTKGRPHSPYADQMLPKYRIGTLKP